MGDEDYVIVFKSSNSVFDHLVLQFVQVLFRVNCIFWLLSPTYFTSSVFGRKGTNKCICYIPKETSVFFLTVKHKQNLVNETFKILRFYFKYFMGD